MTRKAAWQAFVARRPFIWRPLVGLMRLTPLSWAQALVLRAAPRLRAHRQAQARYARALPHRPPRVREADARAMWLTFTRNIHRLLRWRDADVRARTPASAWRAMCARHGRNVSAMSLHFGLWEVGFSVLTRHMGLHTLLLIRADATAPLLARLRKDIAINAVIGTRDGAGLRMLLRFSREHGVNYTTPLLIDVHGRETRTRWLGAPAAVGGLKLAAQLARAQGALVVFVAAQLVDGRARLVASQARAPASDGARARRAVLGFGEALVRARAGQNLWTNNAWRFRKWPEAFADVRAE